MDNEIEKKKQEWEAHIGDNLDKGESVFGLYKGQAFERLTGRMNDREAFALGHYKGITNLTLQSIRMTEQGLNELSSLPSELVPMVKRVKKQDIQVTDLLYKKGMVWVTDQIEAEKLAKIEGYPAIEIEGKYYFQYPGLTISNTIMSDFAVGIAIGSSSLEALTKKGGLDAISQVKAVPQFPAMGSFRPNPEEYVNIREKEEK